MSELTVMERFQQRMTKNWLGHIESSRKNSARERFMQIAKQCRSFYDGGCGFMWGKDWSEEYGTDGIGDPMFKITINKAYELVAIYGPYLFWDYPNRHVQPYEPIEIDTEFIDRIGQTDPMQAQFLGQLMDQQITQSKVAEVRSELMGRYLNYSQREQRQRLAVEAATAIQDALIEGRGLLFPETYEMPGSTRRLTGLFRERNENFFIDPDCNDPYLRNASWIARRHVDTVEDVEDRFSLERGALKEKGTAESNKSRVENGSNSDRINGKTNDLIVWYEIWSKGGIGTHHKGMDSTLDKDLEELLGKYTYVCVAVGVEYFLNAPPNAIEEESDDDIALRFAWPFPSYLDDRWPVGVLDFNINTQSAYPVALLSTALGELMTLNILVSAAVENCYENRRQVVAYLKSASKEIESAFNSGVGNVYIPLDEVNNSINNVVQYLNKPGMNKDIWDAISYVSNMFDKRTGLVEFMYATQSTQDRSARTTAAKQEAASIRPEKMARDVAAWMTECAELERLLATFELRGSDIDVLLGPMGAYLWDTYIYSEDPEIVTREMTCTVEASDVKRPNKEAYFQSLSSLQQTMIPMLQQVAALRGDEEGVEPLRAFVKSMQDAMNQRGEDWGNIPAFQPPPPDPQIQQLEMMMQQLEMELKGAEAHKKTADAAKSAAEAEKTAAEAKKVGLEPPKEQLQFQFDRAKGELELLQKQEKHRQDMAQSAAQFAMKGAMMNQSRALKEQAE